MYAPSEQPFHPPTISSQLADTHLLLQQQQQQQARSFSHGRRTQSMKEQHNTPSAAPLPNNSLAHSVGAAALQGGAGAFSLNSHGQVIGGAALGGGASGGGGEEGASALARRNNTVSTASSRLVRLERTRARLALYVPPSFSLSLSPVDAC